jgi:hypothetical protein
VLVFGGVPWLAVGCGDDRPRAKAIVSSPGAGGNAGTNARRAGTAGPPVVIPTRHRRRCRRHGSGTPMPSARNCADLFDPAVLVDYAFDISAEELGEDRLRVSATASAEGRGRRLRRRYHPIVFPLRQRDGLRRDGCG